MPEVRLVPVYDKKWNVVLYDIFIADRWIGSRRLREQAERAALYYLGENATIRPEAPRS